MFDCFSTMQHMSIIYEPLLSSCDERCATQRVAHKPHASVIELYLINQQNRERLQMRLQEKSIKKTINFSKLQK